MASCFTHQRTDLTNIEKHAIRLIIPLTAVDICDLIFGYKSNTTRAIVMMHGNQSSRFTVIFFKSFTLIELTATIPMIHVI